MRTLTSLFGTLVTCVSLSIPAAADTASAKSMAIADGTVVSLEYTLRDDKGAQLESNKGKEPLIYTQGEKRIIPGLEKAVTGMRTGDEKDVTVTPSEGYGEVNKDAFQEIPKENLPAEALKVGTMLRATSPEGVELPVRVAEIRDKTAVVDFNHPLAGKTLLFHVKVLDVKKPDAPGAAEAKPPAAQ